MHFNWWMGIAKLNLCNRYSGLSWSTANYCQGLKNKRKVETITLLATPPRRPFRLWIQWRNDRVARASPIFFENRARYLSNNQSTTVFLSVKRLWYYWLLILAATELYGRFYCVTSPRVAYLNRESSSMVKTNHWRGVSNFCKILCWDMQ